MESYGHKTKEDREDETGGGEQRTDDGRGRGDGEAAEANEKRQRKKGEGGAAALLPFKSSQKRCSLLGKSSVSAWVQLCNFRRNITCATIGVCMWACLLMELPDSGSAAVSLVISSVSLAVPVQASPTYSEKKNSVYAAKERSKEEQGMSEQLYTPYSAETDKNKYLAGNPRGEVTLQVTARSTVVGEGFHRTMLTTVHIRGNTADELEIGGQDAEKGGKRDKTRSQPAGGNTGAQKEESAGTLRKPGEGEAERGDKIGEGEIGQKVSEGEKEANGGIDVGWEGEHMWDTQKGKSGAKISVSHSGGGPRMGRSQSEGVTPSTQRGEFIKRNEEGHAEIADKDFVDDNNLVCTVRCEYALDKIAYVDPDQTWELGIRGNSTPVPRRAADRVADTPFSTDFAQMGSIEVFPPAVDLEAPVFATHLPPILHVRQTVGDVLLTRLPSSPQKKASHVAALNLGVAHGTTPATRTPGNAFPEESPSSLSKSLPTDDKYLGAYRDGDSDDGSDITDGKVNQTKDIEEDETKKCAGAKDGNSIAEESGEQACYGAASRKADDNTHGSREGRNLQDSSSDLSFRGGSKDNMSYYFEAVVDIELQFHHRYDAPCSGCAGISVHQVETPIVEVVCCRGSAKAQEKAEAQLHRRFHQDESVRATCPQGSIEKCYHQNEVTAKQQQRRSHKQSSYEESVAADECAGCSRSYCTSVKAVATAVAPEQKGADGSFVDGSMPFNGYDSRCYESSSLTDTLETINTSNTELNTGSDVYDQRDAQVDQDAAEGSIDGQRGETGARRHESKKECGGGEQITRFSLQVPVGSAEDLTWATVMTLAAIGICLVATAWILGYAEAQPAAGKKGYEGNFTIAC